MTGQCDGYVYILSNISMPNLVKIGKTRRGGRHRAKEIYQTGVPTPFTLEYEVYTHDCDQLELYAHEHLNAFRVNNDREFFKIDVVKAITELTSLFLGDYCCEVVISDLGDIQSTLESMVKKSGLEDQGFASVLDMHQALDYIDAESINRAVCALLHDRADRYAEMGRRNV